MHRMLRLREGLDHRVEDFADVPTRVFQILFACNTVLRQEFAGDSASTGRHGQRHGRIFVRTHGHFERAAANVDHQQATGIPAVPSASRQEGEACLVNTGKHGDRLSDGVFDAAQDLAAIRRFTQCRRGEHQQLGDLVFLSQLHGLLHCGDHGFDSSFFDGAIFFEVLHQANGAFSARLRLRSGSWSRIDDEHVNSVRTDIKHAESRGMRMQTDHNPTAYLLKRLICCATCH